MEMSGMAKGGYARAANLSPDERRASAQKATQARWTAYRTRQEAEAQGSFVTSLQPLLDAGKTFGCIYADPPWAYQNQGTRGSTDNHYATMSVDALCAMPIGAFAAPQSHLHLWTTNAFLFECPKIFAAWGFDFKSSFVWTKPQIGMGNYWRNAHELLLLGIRGGQRARIKSLRSWVTSKRQRHSEKPEYIRSLVEQLSPGPYLELFGRHAVEGWTVFGNEQHPYTPDLFLSARTIARG